MIFFSEGKFGRKEFVNFISYSRSEVFFNSSNFLEFFDEQDSFSFSHRKEGWNRKTKQVFLQKLSFKWKLSSIYKRVD